MFANTFRIHTIFRKDCGINLCSDPKSSGILELIPLFREATFHQKIDDFVSLRQGSVQCILSSQKLTFCHIRLKFSNHQFWINFPDRLDNSCKFAVLVVCLSCEQQCRCSLQVLHKDWHLGLIRKHYQEAGEG